MAGVSECFSIGSIVACTTCFKQNIEGEVMAFDPSTKMLILSMCIYFYSSWSATHLQTLMETNQTLLKWFSECPQNSSTKLTDVFVVNLSLCSDVQVKQEANGASENPRSLNLQRVRSLFIADNFIFQDDKSYFFFHSIVEHSSTE